MFLKEGVFGFLQVISGSGSRRHWACVLCSTQHLQTPPLRRPSLRTVVTHDPCPMHPLLLHLTSCFMFNCGSSSVSMLQHIYSQKGKKPIAITSVWVHFSCTRESGKKEGGALEEREGGKKSRWRKEGKMEKGRRREKDIGWGGRMSAKKDHGPSFNFPIQRTWIAKTVLARGFSLCSVCICQCLGLKPKFNSILEHPLMGKKNIMIQRQTLAKKREFYHL